MCELLHRMTSGRLVALALALLVAWPAADTALAQTAVDVFEFETEAQERRFQQLSEEFRCPMCQNANLADSPGGVAADLRREIHSLIMEGRTDEEIEQFMHARYGDFIFYRPRFDATTLFLWLGPLFFLLIGGLVIVSIVRNNRNAGLASEKDLSDEEQARLRALLHKRTDSDTDSRK